MMVLHITTTIFYIYISQVVTCGSNKKIEVAICGSVTGGGGNI